MPIYAAILLAVVATSLMNFGMALQKRDAADLPRIGRERSGAVLRAFLLNRRWRRGMALTIGGWGLYLVSTKYAPISIIQPTLGVGLAVLALFSVFYLKEKIRLLEWVAFSAMLAGMIMLGASAVEEGAPPVPEIAPLAGMTLLVLALAVASYLLGKRGMLAGFRTDSLLGIVAGLFIGLAAVYTKAMFTYLDDGRALVGYGICLPIVIAGNVIGMTAVQSGFQHGKALIVVSVLAVTNKVVAIVGGMAVLAEYLPEDPIKAAVRIAAFIMILFGTAALARFGGDEIAERMRTGQA